jgi:hypothetical protein
MSPNSLDPANRWAYRRRALPYLLPTWLLLVAGIGALLDPRQAGSNTVTEVLDARWVEVLWQGSYALAAVLLTVGLLWPKPTVELAGDWLALWALVVNLGAVLIVRGPVGAGLAAFSYLVCIVVISGRIYDLLTRPHGFDRRASDRLADRASTRLDSLERASARDTR